jgi:hypothetical protein
MLPRGSSNRQYEHRKDAPRHHVLATHGVTSITPICPFCRYRSTATQESEHAICALSQLKQLDLADFLAANRAAFLLVRDRNRIVACLPNEAVGQGDASQGQHEH